MAGHVPIPFLNDGQSCNTEVDLSSSCHYLYLFYLGLFAMIVIPLTCLELTELKWLMIGLALFRFISLGTMIITAIQQLYSFPYIPIQQADPEFKPQTQPPFW